MNNKSIQRIGSGFYFIFRVLIGLLFMQHGAQKLFGVLGFPQQELFSLMGLAGVIEFFAGLAIVLGILTRLAALFAGIEMLAAYFIAHAPNSFFPIINKGELALLYFASFMIMTAYGSGRWGIEKSLFKRELI